MTEKTKPVAYMYVPEQGGRVWFISAQEQGHSLPLPQVTRRLDLFTADYIAQARLEERERMLKLLDSDFAHFFGHDIADAIRALPDVDNLLY